MGGWTARLDAARIVVLQEQAAALVLLLGSLLMQVK